MFASIFILILLLPAVCLPLALKTFLSSADLSEMGVCLKRTDATFPVHGYELVCITQDSDKREDTNEYMWEISEGIQICQ